MKALTHNPGIRQQAGVGLIEVLVALLVLSIGILGVAASQALGLRNNQSALDRSQAVILTYSILDAMRADIAAVNAGDYNFDLGEECPKLSGSSLKEVNLKNWLGEIQNTLGADACGAVACANAVCTISIRWDDSRGTDGATAQIVETRTRP